MANSNVPQRHRLEPPVGVPTYRIAISTDRSDWQEDFEATAGQCVVATGSDVLLPGAASRAEPPLFVLLIAR